MNTIAIIAAIIGALSGFGIGYASYSNKNKGVATALGVLGAAIGTIVGVLLAIVILAILIIAFILFTLQGFKL